jgi:CheY-like chemotaxis protein
MFLNQASDTDRVEWMVSELKKTPEVAAGSPVLVVDDDQDLRRGMGRNLEALGYNVLKAEDADEALELATREPPYFILTNADLPWLGTLIYLIRREASLRGVPVVAIYPDRPEEFREDRLVVLNNYRQLEELWPSKTA